MYPVQFFLFTGMGLFPLPDPAGEGAFGLGDVAAVDGEPLRDGRAGRSAADIALGVGEPAALVRAEGTDGLAGEVVVLEEGIDRC